MDDGVSSRSEDENSVGDADSYGSGGESPVVIETEDVKPTLNINGEVTAPSAASQPGISAGLVSSGAYPGVMYQTSNGMVYAAPSSALPNGVIFSLSPQIDPGGDGSSSNRSQGSFRQQLITIPFPMLSTNPGGNGIKTDRDDQEAADLSKNRK
ncbi:UNVERIFIED_CONTAM: hypothetical protein PYX00_003364 [Menopon gallinae]|uniref:Uncharacterized protein n=1 Tax=Menopon gallinae TaxID=328185 RepID=A0AAW2I178_9NEOP